MTAPKLNARSLIVDLLLASAGNLISIKQMVLAGRLFGITENGIRVAVTRLSADGVIEAVERGIYQFSDQSLEWAGLMLNRKNGIKATKPWNQHYFAVFTSMLGRVDRTALKRRERALRNYGFKELEQGLFIRPDNLVATFDDILNQLKANGLEARATMCHIRHFDELTMTKINELWTSELLNKNYEKISYKIQQWLAGRHELELEDAARESLLLGRHTIAQLISDPLLPEPFVNVKIRDQFAADVMELDQIGQQLWYQLFETVLGGPGMLLPKEYRTYPANNQNFSL